jgi:hypothetical protein
MFCCLLLLKSAMAFEKSSMAVEKSFAIVSTSAIESVSLCRLLNMQTQILCHGATVKSVEDIEAILDVPLQKVDIALKASGLNLTEFGLRWKRENDLNEYDMKVSPS